MNGAGEVVKELVANELAARVAAGEIIGIGAGTTVEAVLSALGERVKQEKLKFSVVPASIETALKAAAIGLHVLSPLAVSEISWGFDGADEVDPHKSLLKGRGGALLQEKILAEKCRRYVVIVDQSKLVQRLGERFPVPIEIVPGAISIVERELTRLGATSVELRPAQGKRGPVVTEGGNLIIDAGFTAVNAELNAALLQIVGVVETGIFIGYADEVMVGFSDRVESR